jgi:PAS domain S-box-containing protein
MEYAFPPVPTDDIRAAFERIKDLPFPIYVSDIEGTFLFLNDCARDFFSIGADEVASAHNIQNFYTSPTERTSILRHFEGTTPGVWKQNLEVRLLSKGRNHKIQFVSQAFFDPDGRFCALLCMALSVSNGEWFRDFEHSIEAGYFELDAQYRIRDCNEAFARIFNEKSPEALLALHVRELLWTPSEAELFEKQIEALGHLELPLVKLRRRDGLLVYAKMSSLAYPSPSGGWSGIKGTIADVTPEVIEDNLPVGLFMVSKDAEMRPVITHCNDTFAQIHGFERATDMIGRLATDFQRSPEVYRTYKAALDSATQQGEPLLEHFMEIQNRQGGSREVVVSVRYVQHEGRLVRVGSMCDVTGHERGRIQKLAHNFSALLHTYIATVNGLRDTLTMLSKAHGAEYLREDKYIDRPEALQEVNRRRRRFEEILSELDKVVQTRGLDRLPVEKIQNAWNNLNRPRIEFENKEKDNASWIRRNLIRLNAYVAPLRNMALPKELVRDLRYEIDEMLRLTTVISVSISIDELNERIPEFYYFRDFLRRGDAADLEKPSVQNVLSLLGGQIQKLEEFAASRSVAVVQKYNSRENVPVSCRADLNRAFHNLIHNAIKYSWSKGQDRQAHVDIHVERRKNDVEIIIENWGVAITREELENNEILKFGKRGKVADDRGRSGTGIGLYDAQEVIHQHGGTLRLSSEPTFGNAPDDYKNPFITRAHINLPIVTQQQG